MKQASSISEVIRFVKSHPKAQLWVSQSESYPKGMLIGDEDSTAGTVLKMKIQILAQSPNSRLYFQEEYEDEEWYKEVIEQIERLKESFPVKNVMSSELQARLQ
ncbi:hypothetical protein [Bacillus xiapuensis]|uniref:hypothetical protein n=1 Tax=Bacillus xiapuensis TaxID=2014075 RepID=UPI000C230F2E|nr:hypothetical protein [Bacillus xiapuensis]